MANSGTSVLSSLIAGAIGGAIVTAFLLHPPGRLANIVPTTSGPVSVSGPTVVTSTEEAVVNAVKRVNPAVVSIVITKDVPVLEQYYGQTPNDPFNDFFGNNFFTPFQLPMPQLRQRGTQKQEIGGGSGFLVSADGMIVTNRHVVSEEGASYTVFTNDGKKYDATVVARDPANDVAILKIKGNNFPFLEFTDSDKLQVGQTTIAIGNALGEFRNTVSVGVVSGLSRSITASSGFGQAEQLDQVIQTDAAINPGNSGGPLLNLNGQVIGVNVAVALGSQNVGFALPANLVKSVVDSVKTTGKISRPFLGVRYAMITPALQEQNKLPVNYGALVLRGQSANDIAVVPGSPADKAGLQEGDIILEAEGKKLTDDTTLASIIRQKKVGDTLQLKVLHKGEEKTLNVRLEEMPATQNQNP